MRGKGDLLEDSRLADTAIAVEENGLAALLGESRVARSLELVDDGEDIGTR